MAIPEHVMIARLGAFAIKNWLTETPESVLDLSEADLRGIDLSSANLNRADMRGANLREANLSKATLIEADLSGANLDHAELFSIMGTKIRLDGASLCGTNLREARLEGAFLRTADLSKADLQFTYLDKADLIDTIFRETRLVGATITNAYLYNAEFTKANLAGSDFRRSNIEGASFRECKFANSTLLKVTLDSNTSFADMGDVKECYVDRYTMEYMSESLSKGKMMDLHIRDDIARLRSQFSGVWMWLHMVSLMAFGAPYIWFISHQWVLVQLQGAIPPKTDSIALWEAFLRYLWNGGVGWRQGWSLDLWSFAPFVLVLFYNLVRLILLWKTKRLETEQEVSGLPVQFSLGGDLWYWNVLYQFTVYGYWVTIALVIFNTIHFLSLRIPVAFP